jgi:hypothetical protein
MTIALAIPLLFIGCGETELDQNSYSKAGNEATVYVVQMPTAPPLIEFNGSMESNESNTSSIIDGNSSDENSSVVDKNISEILGSVNTTSTSSSSSGGTVIGITESGEKITITLPSSLSETLPVSEVGE